jgi:hypothetical protein
MKQSYNYLPLFLMLAVCLTFSPIAIAQDEGQESYEGGDFWENQLDVQYDEMMNYMVEIKPYYWASTFDGYLKYVGDNAALAGILPKKIDIDDLLNVKDDQDIFMGRITGQPWQKHKIHFTYYSLDYDGVQLDIVDAANNLGIPVDSINAILPDGSQITSDYIVIGDIGFRGAVATDANLNMYELGYEYDFVWQPQGYLGGLFEVKFTDVGYDIRALGEAVEFQPDGTAHSLGLATGRTHKDWFLPVPVIGIVGRYYPHPRFSIGGEIKGMYAGDYGHVFDTYVSAEVNIFKNFAISGGYRYFEFNIDDVSNLTIDISVDGPFVGAKIRF